MKKRNKVHEFPTPIRSIVEKILSGAGLDKMVQASRVVKLWDTVVGPTIAGHAQPRSFREGTLIVNVDSSVWLAQLDRYRKRQIKERLNRQAGQSVVRKIVFVIGELKPLEDKE